LNTLYWDFETEVSNVKFAQIHYLISKFYIELLGWKLGIQQIPNNNQNA